MPALPVSGELMIPTGTTPTPAAGLIVNILPGRCCRRGRPSSSLTRSNSLRSDARGDAEEKRGSASLCIAKIGQGGTADRSARAAATAPPRLLEPRADDLGSYGDQPTVVGNHPPVG